jgi:hypothetical protein
MKTVLFQFRHSKSTPNFEDLRREFGFNDDEFDMDYGIILIDPADASYVIRVNASAQTRLAGKLTTYRDAQFFSDPTIEPLNTDN